MRELSENEKEDLNRKLLILQKLTYNSVAAKMSAPLATITYFSPCTDPESDSFGSGGRYITITRVVSKVDPIGEVITLDGMELQFQDLLSIQR